MAKEEKKGAAAPAGAPARGLMDIVPVIVFGLIAVFLIRMAYNYFVGVNAEVTQAEVSGVETIYTQISDVLIAAMDWYIKIATIFCAVTVLAIAYAYMRLRQVNSSVAKKDEELNKKTAPKKKSVEGAKWEKVVAHINSDNPAEWRLSILEADVLLEHMLDSKGYHAETLGEKLKSIPPGQFKSLQAAWEAHKVRNTIAHQGADFVLNQRDAKRVIDMYQQVLSELSAS